MWHKTRLLVFLLMLLASVVHAQNIRELRVSGTYTHVSLTTVFDALEQQTPVKFYFDTAWFNTLYVDVSFLSTPLPDALDKLLARTPYMYDVFQENAIIIIPRDAVADFMGSAHFYADDITDFNTRIIGHSDAQMAQKKCLLTGTVKDARTGEAAEGVSVSVKRSSQAVLTDQQGRYSLSLSPGIYELHFGKLGFDESFEKIKLLSSGTMNIDLYEKVVQMDEVVVSGKRADRNVSNTQMSIIELDRKAIKELPSSFGEKDIIRAMTNLPGIKSVGEFGSSINVRGSGGDQNLFLLDEAPIFNSAHIFGLTSVINADAVGGVTLYKGDIPAQYGERVSSVMNIDLKNGDMHKLHVNGGIGLINSRLTVEGPLLKDSSASFMISGRTTYSDWLLRSMPDLDLKNSRAGFNDLIASAGWRIKTSNRLSASVYRSSDMFNYNKVLAYNYTNLLSTLKWVHTYNNQWYSTISSSFSRYAITREDKENAFTGSKTSADISYASIKCNLNYTPGIKHKITGGIQGIHYMIQPGTLVPTGYSLIIAKSLQPEQAIETAAFISDKFDISPAFSINAGLRYSAYTYLGPRDVYNYDVNTSRKTATITDTISYGAGEKIQSYQLPEPRISLKYQINSTGSVKLSYNKNTQYISLLSYTSIPTPDDVWKLSDGYLQPLRSQQLAAGLFKNFKKNSIETSVELYYKDNEHLIDYKNNATLNMNEAIETVLIDAHGRNYGVELFARKKGGKLHGWMSYTYARSYKQTTGTFKDDVINNNNWYPSSFDIPHDLSISGSYLPNRLITFAFTFSYRTGRAITLPEYKYRYGNYWLIHYSERNAYRLPDYHRLDVSITLNESLKRKKKWKSSWTLAVMNVYGRQNAYSIYYRKELPSADNEYEPFGLYKLYFIGMPFPTLTYNFTF